MFFRFRHRKWVKTTGRVLDSRIRKVWVNGSPPTQSIPLHNYIIEFVAPNGEKTKLEVEQQLATRFVEVGKKVPLLVSPDGKRAVFDRDDPEIKRVNLAKQQHKADEERFRKHLDG